MRKCMSATKKQIKANKQNAQKSTGPKTEQGKEIVSQNATTFGLYSNKLTINSKYHTEDRVGYDLLIEDLRFELDPHSFFQEHLIKKIANCLWRSQRAAFAETAYINKQLGKLDDEIQKELFLHTYKMRKNKHLVPLDFTTPDSRELSNLIGINTIPDKKFATKILHYEMRLDRQLARTYELLQKLQYKEKLEKMEKAKKRKNDKTNPIPYNPMTDIE